MHTGVSVECECWALVCKGGGLGHSPASDAEVGGCVGEEVGARVGTVAGDIVVGLRAAHRCERATAPSPIYGCLPAWLAGKFDVVRYCGLHAVRCKVLQVARCGRKPEQRADQATHAIRGAGKHRWAVRPATEHRAEELRAGSLRLRTWWELKSCWWDQRW